MTTPSLTEQANALCIDCGLCCDGTFFGGVTIAAAERPRLSRVGLRIVDSDGALVMPQPCSALSGTLCTVYADRPDGCARYECTLRKDIIAGAKTATDARADMLRLRALLARFGVPAERSMWQAVVALEEPPARGSSAETKYDADLDAMGELLELTRAAFEPSGATTSEVRGGAGTSART